jgi:hypothetical protein
MITWEGELLYEFPVFGRRAMTDLMRNRLFINNFSNGGYAGSVYGFIIVWIGTICVFATMGELASMYVSPDTEAKAVLIGKSGHQPPAGNIIGSI